MRKTIQNVARVATVIGNVTQVAAANAALSPSSSFTEPLSLVAIGCGLWVLGRIQRRGSIELSLLKAARLGCGFVKLERA